MPWPFTRIRRYKSGIRFAHFRNPHRNEANERAIWRVHVILDGLFYTKSTRLVDNVRITSGDREKVSFKSLWLLSVVSQR